MLIVALLLKIKEKRVIFCISLERLNNAVFGNEIAVGLKLTQEINFRVACPMFNRVFSRATK